MSTDFTDFSKVSKELVNIIKRRNEESQAKSAELANREQQLTAREQEIAAREQELNHLENNIDCRNADLIMREQEQHDATKSSLCEAIIKAGRVASILENRETMLRNLEHTLINKEADLDIREETIERKRDTLYDLEYVAAEREREFKDRYRGYVDISDLQSNLEKSERLMSDSQCKIWMLIKTALSSMSAETTCDEMYAINVNITTEIMQIRAELKSVINAVRDKDYKNSSISINVDGAYKYADEYPGEYVGDLDSIESVKCIINTLNAEFNSECVDECGAQYGVVNDDEE